MRRGRIFFLFAFLLLVVLVILLVVYLRFFRQPAGTEGTEVVVVQPTPALVMVLAVSQDIDLGGALSPDVLTAIPWPRDAANPEDYFVADNEAQLESVKKELDGRTVRYPIKARTPLLKSMLRQEGEFGSEFSVRIPHGQVAISIPINKLSSVSYAPRPGDHVDVIATFLFVDIDTDFQSSTPNHTGLVTAPGPPNPETGEPTTVQLTAGVSNLGKEGLPNPETNERNPPQVLAPGIYGKVEIDPVLGQAIYLTPSEDQRPRMVSQRLLEDVTVLQIGTFPLQGQQVQQTTEEEQQPTEEGNQAPAVVIPDVITLIMRPQDAIAVNYVLQAQAHASVRLSLALRAANDTARIAVLPVTLQFLLEQYQIPVPAKLPYALQPRTDELTP
jgi:Flp pilus assembly protein CpaB